MGFGGKAMAKKVASMTKAERMAKERAVLSAAANPTAASNVAPKEESSHPGPQTVDTARLAALEQSLVEKEAHVAKLKEQVQEQQKEITAMLTSGKSGECELCLTKKAEIAAVRNDFLHAQATLEDQVKRLEGELSKLYVDERQASAAANSSAATIKELQVQLAAANEKGEKSKQLIKDLLRDVDALTRKNINGEAGRSLPLDEIVTKKDAEIASLRAELLAIETQRTEDRQRIELTAAAGHDLLSQFVYIKWIKLQWANARLREETVKLRADLSEVCAKDPTPPTECTECSGHSRSEPQPAGRSN